MYKLLKRPRFNYLYFIVGFMCLTGCKNDEILNTPEEETKEINLVFDTFIFEKENNPFLSEDIVFDVNDNTVSGELKNYFFNSIPTFSSNATTVEINSTEQISGKDAVDFRKEITYTLKSESGATKEYTVDISWDDALAHIYFDTEGGSPIVSKDDYLNGNLRIDGQSKYDDLTILNNVSRIKGRGNTTWGWPKKPYKIKLDSKESILGLLPEKDWVLLADYQDGPHLLNAVAFTVGRMLEMPFTNTIIPVELTINGEYLGVYGLTEQIEIKKNRVNVGKNDGLLLELDKNYDEEWQFKSAAYNLPVLVKDPKLNTAQELTAIKNDFETFEALVASDDFPNNNYLDYIDGESIAKYFIVYMLTSNIEINHPKSTYIHKTATGKYTMGPIWDFDWAYGYAATYTHFSNPNEALFWTETSPPGTQFFSRLMLSDPIIKALVKEYWSDFKINHLDDLMDYIDEQTFIIKGAKARNLAMWDRGLITSELTMKRWIKDRVSYMNTFISNY